MKIMAAALARFADRPVTDMTELNGNYDFTMEFSPEDFRAMMIRATIAQGSVVSGSVEARRCLLLRYPIQCRREAGAQVGVAESADRDANNRSSREDADRKVNTLGGMVPSNNFTRRRLRRGVRARA
jgi:uncharacterized protein (TIGR03435 family)